ncbi:MAG: hypothetical protein ACYC63_18280 [Armatimonadota bacterium]
MKTVRALLISILLLIPIIACAQSMPDMVNVADSGASGSQFQTAATAVAGSNLITVADAGDFKVGQGVMLSRVNPHYKSATLWGPRSEYIKSVPVKDLVQMRGYDGSAGSWTVYVIDIAPGTPPTFRWSDDLCRTWKESKIAITGDWQKLSGGTEIKFAKHDWEKGYAVTFSARDQLTTTIEKIDGKTITLKDPCVKAATDAILRHNDTVALQATINQAIEDKRNVYFPPGTYRLSQSLLVKDATGITIEGSDGVNCILDISEGEGACFDLLDGREVNLRNFRMIGNTGFDQRDQAGYLALQGARNVWGFYLKPCHGVKILQTERVVAENLHASKMSGECFYCSGRSRTYGKPEPAQYTKSLVWSRCSVTDSARNAFNNNNMSENTSVLNCRIVDVGGCTWEGASRFVRFIGNYVRNAGTVAMGNVRSRAEIYEKLGTGQHIVADNVFEGNICYGGAAIRAGACASQVIIRDNLFINFNSSGIDISGMTGPLDLPAGISTISGNIMDMTDVTGTSAPRTAVEISAPSVIVSNNQVYVRGATDPQVIALKLREPALDLKIHDNQIRNVGTGLIASRASGVVAEVKDNRTFLAPGRGIPMERRDSHRYRGWNVVWLQGQQVTGQSVIESFDPETLEFKLTAPAKMKVGDGLELYPPSAGWDIHHNSFSGCAVPVVLDGYGSPTSLFRDNMLTREPATGVKEALVSKGRYALQGNQFTGFDEAGSVTLSLYPDRLGKAPGNLYENNFFQRCAVPVQETQQGLWSAGRGGGNSFIECGAKPKELTAPVRDIVPQLLKVQAPAPALLKAGKLAKPVKLDGAVSEWPWSDKQRVQVIAQNVDGQPYLGPKSFMLAASDKTDLYLAIKVLLPTGYKPKVSGGQYDGDGLELAFQSAEAQSPSPLYVMWGGAGGNFGTVQAGGATAEQMNAAGKAIKYAAKITADGWTCEWRIPLSLLGSKPQLVKRLRMNVGILEQGINTWVVWAGTGAEIFRVERAGELILER